MVPVIFKIVSQVIGIVVKGLRHQCDNTLTVGHIDPGRSKVIFGKNDRICPIRRCHKRAMKKLALFVRQDGWIFKNCTCRTQKHVRRIEILDDRTELGSCIGIYSYLDRSCDRALKVILAAFYGRVDPTVLASVVKRDPGDGIRVVDIVYHRRNAEACYGGVAADNRSVKAGRFYRNRAEEIHAALLCRCRAGSDLSNDRSVYAYRIHGICLKANTLYRDVIGSFRCIGSWRYRNRPFTGICTVITAGDLNGNVLRCIQLSGIHHKADIAPDSCRVHRIDIGICHHIAKSILKDTALPFIRLKGNCRRTGGGGGDHGCLGRDYVILFIIEIGNQRADRIASGGKCISEIPVYLIGGGFQSLDHTAGVLIRNRKHIFLDALIFILIYVNGKFIVSFIGQGCIHLADIRLFL